MGLTPLTMMIGFITVLIIVLVIYAVVHFRRCKKGKFKPKCATNPPCQGGFVFS